MKYTVEQKIRIANIISKSNPQNLPYILDIFGIERKTDIEVTPLAPQSVDETVSDFLTEIDDINGMVSSVVYKAYCDYCKGKEAQPITHIEFSRQVNRALKSSTIVKRFNNTVCRVFLRERGGCYETKG